MNLTEMVRKLKAVAFALNEIEVKGSKNMDALLGSIQAIEQVARAMEYEMQQMKPKEEPEIKVEVVPEDKLPAE